jgi:uncharacterized membrane protein YozB (DUF420 family)
LSGIFGTGALLQADINLIVQILMFLVIVFGIFYKVKKKFKKHGQLMGVALVLHILSFVAVMGPVFFTDLEGLITYTGFLEVQTMWIHAISGAVSMVLGTAVVVLWALNPMNIAACAKRKRIMDITTLLWLISLIFGIVTYVLFYV